MYCDVLYLRQRNNLANVMLMQNYVHIIEEIISIIQKKSIELALPTFGERQHRGDITGRKKLCSSIVL